jgi:uncharacterized protein (TIRG00374 family)
MRRWQKPLVLSVVLAIALYFVGMVTTDFHATRTAVARMDWVAWAAVIALSLLNYLLRFVRWTTYIRHFSHVRLPTGRHSLYYLSGFALSTTPGKAGEAIRSLYLHPHGVGYHQSISALFVERLLDMLAITLLAVLACIYFPQYQWVALLTSVIAFGGLIVVHQKWAIDWLERQAERLGAARKLVKHLAIMLRSALMLMRSRQLVGGLALGVIAWGGEGIGLYLILKAMGAHVDLWLAVSIYGIAVLVGAVSFLPGGLGGTEAAMTLLLIASGVDKSTALAATLVCRVATLWFAVALGLIAMSINALNPIKPIPQEQSLA